MNNVKKELEMVAEIRRRWHEASGLGGAHYSTRDDIVRKVGLPYTLVQDVRDDLGKVLRNYRYRWTSKWDKGSLYLQETEAGNRQYRSMDAALDALERVLRNNI